MSDEPNITTPPTAAGDGEKGSTPAKLPESIPYERFQEVNNANKLLSDKLKTIEAQNTATAEAAAKEKGEFEKLYNDNLSKIKGYDELNTTLTNILNTTIESIPEDKRKLIPTEYSPQKQLDWINSNREMLVGTSSKNAPVQPSNPQNGKVFHKASNIKDLKYYEANKADIRKALAEGRIID